MYSTKTVKERFTAQNLSLRAHDLGIRRVCEIETSIGWQVVNDAVKLAEMRPEAADFLKKYYPAQFEAAAETPTARRLREQREQREQNAGWSAPKIEKTVVKEYPAREFADVAARSVQFDDGSYGLQIMFRESQFETPELTEQQKLDYEKLGVEPKRKTADALTWQTIENDEQKQKIIEKFNDDAELVAYLAIQ